MPSLQFAAFQGRTSAGARAISASISKCQLGGLEEKGAVMLDRIACSGRPGKRERQVPKKLRGLVSAVHEKRAAGPISDVDFGIAEGCKAGDSATAREARHHTELPLPTTRAPEEDQDPSPAGQWPDALPPCGCLRTRCS